MQCKDCKEKLQCGTCLKMHEKTQWSKKTKKEIWMFRKPVRLCTTCRTKGCTPTNPALYACRSCGVELGAAYCKKNALKQFKFHIRIRHKCITYEKAVDERLKDLQKEFRWSKVFGTYYCQMHTDRCHLSPRYFEERRWPDCYGLITTDDRIFHAKLKPIPAWWFKARCKK